MIVDLMPSRPKRCATRSVIESGRWLRTLEGRAFRPRRYSSKKASESIRPEVPPPRMTPRRVGSSRDEVEAGGGEGFPGGRHAHAVGARHAPPLGGREEAVRDLADLRRRLGAVAGGVEERERADAALAREETLPGLVEGRSEGGDGTHSGNDDAATGAWYRSYRGAGRGPAAALDRLGIIALHGRARASTGTPTS